MDRERSFDVRPLPASLESRFLKLGLLRHRQLEVIRGRRRAWIRQTLVNRALGVHQLLGPHVLDLEVRARPKRRRRVVVLQKEEVRLALA